MNTCPKCGTPDVADACHKCGLVFARYNPDVLDEGVPEELKALWVTVVDNWDKKEAHAIFFEQALLRSQGAFAARCYRSKGDDPKAHEQLARLFERLEQQLLMGHSKKRAGNKFLRYLAYLLFGLAISVTMLYFLWISK